MSELTVLYMCPDDLPRIVGDNGIGVPVYGGTFGRYTLPLVTHADYRALEEELAELRVRVGDLVASVEAHESKRLRGSACMKSWTDAQKDDHLDRMTDTQERRRLALEGLK
jgi:hypothetical protein